MPSPPSGSRGLGARLSPYPMPSLEGMPPSRVPASVQVQGIFQKTGFGFIQTFFKDWLKMDLDFASLAVILAVMGALSSGVTQVRALALTIYQYITRFFTADRLNREVLNWIGDKVLMQQEARILTARSEAVQTDAMHYRHHHPRLQQRVDYLQEKRLPIQYLPTFGTTWFMHEQNLFMIRRVPQEGRSMMSNMAYAETDQYQMAPMGNEPLVVMCLGRSVKPIKKFLDGCRNFAEQQREAFITVRASRNQYHRESWDTTILRPIRPLDTVHMDKVLKHELVSDLENYLKPSTRRFYTNRGIPYRRGYLLHGPPGTGKTSLSLALAGRFGLDLYILHIPSLKEDSELERLFTALPPQCIVLLEDIDAVGMKRVPTEDDEEEDNERKAINLMRGSSKCTLSGLLNVLDGVTSQEGRIVLMTSNIADKLDDALVRPGRIDKMIFLGNIYQEAAEEMFLRMYAPDQTEAENGVTEPITNPVDMDPEELQKLASSFSAEIPDDVFTPAQLQGYLLNHRSRPRDAAAGAGLWVESEKDKMRESRQGEAEMTRKRAHIRARTAKQHTTDSMRYPGFPDNMLSDLLRGSLPRGLAHLAHGAHRPSRGDLTVEDARHSRHVDKAKREENIRANRRSDGPDTRFIMNDGQGGQWPAKGAHALDRTTAAETGEMAGERGNGIRSHGEWPADGEFPPDY